MLKKIISNPVRERGARILSLTRIIQITSITLILGLTLSCTVRTSRRTIGSPDPIKIQDIRVAKGNDKTIIELESEEPILYTSFRLSNPDRLVIEMADVTFGQYQDEIRITEGPVKSIRLASSGELDVSRLELELNGLVKTEVRPEGLNIVVEVTHLEKVTGVGKTPKVEPKHQQSFIFFGDETGPASEIMAGLPKDGEAQSGSMGNSELSVPETPVPPSTRLTSAPTAKPENPREKSSDGVLEKQEKPITSPAKVVTAVRFQKGESLRLVVSSDGRLSPTIFLVGKPTKDRLVIDLPGVKTQMKINRIPGDDVFVKQARFGQHPKKFRIVLDLKKSVSYEWDQKQTELWVTLK